ncbi:hypothetical protein MIT9_P2125 [Methylomarinovum caldicuralii]|uniref:Secreted protein n=1 Tax=Methylomarinovum caldicuralii TaxID=438856 RepID=A0AAU9C5X7_9GAMM|nr:hypothetical protein [Methylomarinovum caldicuralii]BCX82539.1 hypothetical protein MIT9_P2125 [Methylomarinovum caldicuralii]
MTTLRFLLALTAALSLNVAQAGLWGRLFGPDNYWECLLDEMPGTLTYGGSMEKLAQCKKRFPDPTAYKPGKGLLGPKDFQGCLAKYLETTKEALARHSIQNACFRLFPPN